MKSIPLLALSLLVAGCGGGGNGSSPASGPGPVASFGPVTLEGFVSDAPVRASGSTSSFIGIAGDFSSIVYQNPNPRVEQTLFTFGEANSLFNVDFDGGNQRQILDGFRPSMISYSPGAGTLFFSNIADKTFRSMPVTGGASSVIGTGEMEFGSVNPAGTKFAYVRRTSANVIQLRQANLDGTSDAFVSSISSSSPVEPGGFVWVGDARAMWASKSSVLCSSTTTSNNFFVSGVGGDTQVLAASRDGRIAFVETGAEGSKLITKLTFQPGVLLPIGREDYDLNKDVLAMAISPDRRYVATLEVNEGASPGNVLLVRRNFDMTGATTVRSLEPDTQASGLGWSPFPTNRVLAGAASLFGGNASAFIWGASGNEMSGAVLVRAQTPSTAKIDAEGASGSNLFYAVECDKITKASISVDKGQAFANIALTPTTNGILVNFNGASGEVMAAMPYAVTRGSGKPKVVRDGSLTTVTGEVQAVYNAKGKNLAPGGAARVVIHGDRIEVER